MSTLAVFIALGGSSYAAFTISGSRSRTARSPARNCATTRSAGAEIKRIAARPGAARANADRLGGLTAAEPEDPLPERHVPDRRRLRRADARAAASYGSAVLTCLGSRHTRGAGPAAADPRRAARGADGACSSLPAAS